MSLLRPLSAVDQAESAIEKAIVEKRWRDVMPSYHDLCRLLGVSGPTVAKAVRRLLSRGLLVSAGPRKRLRIVAGKTKVEDARRAGTAARPFRHLVIVSQKGEGDDDAWTRRVALEGMESAIADGWKCSVASLDFVNARRVVKRWDNLLLHHPDATHLLVVGGTATLAEWALGKNLELAFVGGQLIRDKRGANIGIRISQVLGDCAERLRRMGHRRILMPYWGQAGFARFAAKVIAAKTGDNPDRLVAEGWAFEAWPTTPKAHRERLSTSIKKLRPTAIIAFSRRDYMVASQCAAAAGLRIPQDLSLVLLGHSEDVDWELPIPSHYKVDVRILAKGITDWRQGKTVSADQITRSVVRTWNEGETVGPARKDD